MFSDNITAAASGIPASYLSIALTILLSFLILGYVSWQRFLCPLADIPGPFLASLTPAWKLLAVRTGLFHEHILALHKKYGPIVRIAPSEVIISEGKAIREIYSSTNGRDYLKTDYYDAFVAFRPTIFGQRDPDLHAKRKRIVSHGYSMNALQSMENFVQEQLRIFLRKMSGFSARAEALDLGKWCHFFAFDVIGELAFSEGFGMLETGVEDAHIKLINNQIEFGSVVGMMPSLIPYTKWTWFPLPWLQRLQTGREQLKELTRSKVERRKEKPADRKDLLGRLIEATDPVTGEKLDVIDLRTEAFSSIVAGSDSTSSALAYTFYHILSRRSVYNRLTDELRGNLKCNEVDGDKLRIPKYSDLATLPYLQACIKESLRLTPPAALNLPRYVPKGGRVIAGKYFPAMTTVGISPLPVHLSKQNFGPDADAFNPDRWEKGSGEASPEEMNKYWIPFGHGIRSCIGKNVAMLELVKLVGTVLLNFDIELVGTVGSQGEIPSSRSFFFARMSQPLEVRMHERKS